MARILLVDDDQDLLNVARRLLASANHDVMVAENALTAVDLLGSYEFDAALIDVNMPLHSGFDLLRTLRKEAKFQNLAIAMLTGRRETGDVTHALSLGADDYIVKPLEPIVFLKKIDQLFGSKPAPLRPSAVLSPSHTSSQAKITVDVVVKSVTELGLVVQTNQNFREGSHFEMTSEIFDQIGIRAPKLKVLSTIPDARYQNFDCRVIFIGLDEVARQKIRNWIFQRMTNNRWSA